MSNAKNLATFLQSGGSIAGDANFDSNTLFVDASANAVGIGTNSPQGDGIHIKVPDDGTGVVLSGTTTTAGTEVRLSALNEAATAWHDLNIGSNQTIFRTAGTTALTIDASQNVGIGTSSPITISSAGPTLEVSGTAGGTLVLTDSNATSGQRSKYFLSQGGALYIGDSADDGSSPSNNVVVDASGRLLVGKTTNAIGTAGHTLQKDGFFSATRSAAYVAGFNRLSDDGEIVQFFKDGSTVGSIGAVASQLYVAGGDTGLQLNGTADQIRPCDGSGAARDAAIDLGDSTRRFKDLYLGGKAIINRDSDDDFIQIQRGGTTRARIGITSSDNLYIDATTNGGAGLQFWGAGGSDPYITPREEGSDNDNVTSLGRGVNRFKDLYLGGSVYLGGTGSANALDDYEEGTCSVSLLTTGSPNPTYTIDNSTAYYTKIGRLVTVNFYSGAINMTSAGSGAARISGLPFNATSTSYGQYSVVNVTHTTAFTSNVEGGITLGNSTQMAFYSEGSVSSMAFTTGNPVYIMFTVTYWTD